MRPPRSLTLIAAFICLLVFSPLPAEAQFSQQGPKLVRSGVGSAAHGFSVSLSADGNTALIGGILDDNSAGGAWVWTRNGGVWTQQGPKLVGTGGGSTQQGFAVSLSADGNTALVGGLSDNATAGAAWVWTRSGGVWTQQGPALVGTGAVGSAQLGQSVSLSADGNTAMVGGLADNSGAGAVWVWTRSGGVWTQQGLKLVGTGAVANAQQGRSVSLSADGNTALVGGERDNNSTGAVWVWTRNAGVWTQQGGKLVGSDAVGAARQGWSVSLSADGNTAVVGGTGDNGSAGAAWVWTRSGAVWTQQGAKLVGTGAVGSAQQGRSVSLSADGNTALVAGHTDKSSAGAAWVWTRSGGVWTQQGAKLVGAGAVGNAQQGWSAALSGDGNTALVGGPFDNATAGAAWVFVAPSNGPSLCGDFDGDGNSDLLWQHTDGSTAMWLMNGLVPTGGATLLGPGTGWSAKQVGDFNGDGRSDILWQHTDGSVFVWLMNGTGVIGSGSLLGPGTGWRVKLVGDLDGDGKQDIVWQHTDGSVFVWLMNGTSVTSTGGVMGADSGWAPVYLADLNGDGKGDIIWQHADGSVFAWLMNGTGVIESGGLLGAGTGWSVRSGADFNGDHKQDLLWKHSDGSIFAWLMNGIAVMAGGALRGPVTGWSPVQTGDLNGDGKGDIVWQHTDGSTALWLMDGLTLASGGGLLGAGTGWTPVQTGDFNGDRKSDLVWHHSNGTTALWLMDGLTPVAGGDLLGAGSGWSPVP